MVLPDPEELDIGRAQLVGPYLTAPTLEPTGIHQPRARGELEPLTARPELVGPVHKAETSPEDTDRCPLLLISTEHRTQPLLIDPTLDRGMALTPHRPEPVEDDRDHMRQRGIDHLTRWRHQRDHRELRPIREEIGREVRQERGMVEGQIEDIVLPPALCTLCCPTRTEDRLRLLRITTHELDLFESSSRDRRDLRPMRDLTRYPTAPLSKGTVRLIPCELVGKGPQGEGIEPLVV